MACSVAYTAYFPIASLPLALSLNEAVCSLSSWEHLFPALSLVQVKAAALPVHLMPLIPTWGLLRNEYWLATVSGHF